MKTWNHKNRNDTRTETGKSSTATFQKRKWSTVSQRLERTLCAGLLCAGLLSAGSIGADVSTVMLKKFTRSVPHLDTHNLRTICPVSKFLSRLSAAATKFCFRVHLKTNIVRSHSLFSPNVFQNGNSKNAWSCEQLSRLQSSCWTPHDLISESQASVGVASNLCKVLENNWKRRQIRTRFKPATQIRLWAPWSQFFLGNIACYYHSSNKWRYKVFRLCFTLSADVSSLKLCSQR
jgi:hypothetical protein